MHEALSEPELGRKISHPVVAIGASAGGLEALQEFFGNVPSGLGASFVVVQHLSPDYRSMLDELISRHTTLPVHVVEDGTQLEPDNIYIIPPAHNLICDGDRLHLRNQPERGSGRLNLSIDLFFVSLAKNAMESALAVVLSGTGSDGAAGLTEISECGGVVLVQDPATAKFDGMPISAIQTGLADVIGSPSQLAGRVADHVRHPVTPRDIAFDKNDDASAALTLVVDMLSTEFDVHLHDYKPTTLLRRIARRVPLSQSPSLRDYIDLVRTDPDELRTLLDDLLIGVTSFFRDPDAWGVLSEKVIKQWVGASASDELRAWVCACSTGEEAYTLAMLAAEAFDMPKGKAPPVRIFATDISKNALQVAATAIYPRAIAQVVSAERLSRFFEEYDDQYRVRPEIRRTVVFAPHDVTRQTPFSRMNLVTCRNMLIYMQPNLQKRVLSLLHYALRPGGALFLGSAEGLLDLSDSFQSVDTKARLFVSRHQSAGLVRTQLRAAKAIEVPAPRSKRENQQAAQEFLLDATLSAVFKREAASGVLVSRSDHLMRVIGETPDFMRIPVGVATNEIRDLLPRNLSLSVATALHRARSSNEHVWLRNVHFLSGDVHHVVDVAVMPLSALKPEIEVDLVTFRPAELSSEDAVEKFDLDEVAQRRLSMLERELEQSRENLQATIEELETTNEEQQATNEELIASNEELQSTNEELHSVNEELHTVNSDYQHKIEQLVELNIALDGLLDAVDVGIIFLSDDGRVLRFNAVSTMVFNLTNVDVGRPLAHLSDTMVDSADRDGLMVAVENHRPYRQTISTNDRVWRVGLIELPAFDDVGQRQILTLVDVTDLERTTVDLARQTAVMNTLSRGLPDVLWVRGTSDSYEYISRGFEKIFGESVDWAFAQPDGWAARVHPEDRALAQTSDAQFDVTYRIQRKDGSMRWVRCRGYPVDDAQGHRLCTIGTVQDVSADVEQREIKDRLLQRQEQTVLALGEVLYDRDLDAETIEWWGDLFDAFGYRENTIGNDRQSWIDRIHPDDLQRVRDEFARANHSDGRMELRYRFRRADGTFAWVHDRGYASMTGDRVSRVVGVIKVLDGGFDATGHGARAKLFESLGAAQWRWWTDRNEWSLDDSIVRWIPDVEDDEQLREVIKEHIHLGLDSSGTVEFMHPVDESSEGILFSGVASLTETREIRFHGYALRLADVARDLGMWRRHGEILDNLDEGITLLSEGGEALWTNRTAKSLTGLDRPMDSLEQALLRRTNPGAPVDVERVIAHPTLGARVLSAHRRVLPDGTVLAIDRDVTEQREAERVLQRRASVDALTGLFLRNRFIEALTHEAARSTRDGAAGFAVVFMDLDGFKEVNDSYDHFVGNELLKAFADRLRTLFRPGDTVARFGGDEFAVLVEDVDDYRDALAVAERIHQANLQPLTVGDRQFTIGASIGIAVWDPTRHSPEGLLRDADVAMYEAKRRSDEKTVVFDAQMHARVLLRHETKRDLHAALDRREFELFLQPMVFGDGRPMGFEALLRWRHPRRGVLTPSMFLQLASESGELLDLEAWVLGEVLNIVDSYPTLFSEQRRSTLSLNATPNLLRSQAFARWVERVAAQGYADRADFVVEIVEETMLDGDPSVRLAVERARDANVRIAVDDFGTGYSSLSYLIHWPIDVIKLDGTFAQRGTRDLRGDMVVCALVDLARSLGITTILEGVESTEQLDFARSVKVDAVQGYHLGYPRPVTMAIESAVQSSALQN